MKIVRFTIVLLLVFLAGCNEKYLPPKGEECVVLSTGLGACVNEVLPKDDPQYESEKPITGYKAVSPERYYELFTWGDEQRTERIKLELEVQRLKKTCGE